MDGSQTVGRGPWGSLRGYQGVQGWFLNRGSGTHGGSGGRSKGSMAGSKLWVGTLGGL